jgi:hypothetical protein
MRKKLQKPLSILDKTFVYIPAVRTNVLETWKKYGFVPPSESKWLAQQKEIV